MRGWLHERLKGNKRSKGGAKRPTDLSVFGVRRVSFVRITLGDGKSPRCEVSGLGHRRPVRRQVPLHIATWLAARGVPTVVRRKAA